MDDQNDDIVGAVLGKKDAMGWRKKKEAKENATEEHDPTYYFIAVYK